MKQIGVQSLSMECFQKYGSYVNMLRPAGAHLGAPPCEFYRDMNVMTLNGDNNVAFSITRAYDRPRIIEEAEFHDHTCEMILPLDGDIYIHVAAATQHGDVPYDAFEVFYVPQGTLVTVHPGVWHAGPFCVNTSAVNVLVALPERTYANDCSVVKFPAEQKIEIQA